MVMTVVEQKAPKSTEKSGASTSLACRRGKTLQWEWHQGWACSPAWGLLTLVRVVSGLIYVLHPSETNVWNTAPRSTLIFSLRPQEKSESRLSVREKICPFPWKMAHSVLLTEVCKTLNCLNDEWNECGFNYSVASRLSESTHPSISTVPRDHNLNSEP